MDMAEAVELALDGHAILFAGAGFSRGAINRSGQPIKLASELATHLASKTNLPKDTPLEDTAEEFRYQFGEQALVRLLKDEFTAREITETHRRIANLPWRGIYTTNYDNVLEKASLDVGRTLTPITLSQEARLRSDESGTLCVHLNGYVDTLTSASIGDELKLTDTSYLTASVSESPWGMTLRQDLSLARAVFFVGYSLADLDIRRIIFESEELKQKSFFIVGRQPADLIKRRVSRFGKVISTDASDFSDVIEEKSRVYVPRSPDRHVGYSITKYSIPPTVPTFTDQAIFDLLLFGASDPALVWSSINEEHRYFLNRRSTKNILDAFRKGTRVVVTHSELGNGKTIFLEGLKCRAVEEGYDVYSVSERSSDTLREMDQILGTDSKALIVIDDYPGWLDVAQHFAHYSGPNHFLALSARNAVHELMIDNLYEILGTQNVIEYPLDSLDSRDLDWIVSFFDQYGLWGDKAAWSTRRKKNYLSGRCRSQFSSILIDLFESPDIATRFRRILQGLNDKRGYYEVLLSAMALVVIKEAPSSGMMTDIWGQKVLESNFKRNTSVSEIFDLQAGTFRIRSGLAAQFILKRVADANITIDALIAMAGAFNKARRYSRKHYDLFRDMMRFSTLQNLLPERQRRPATIRYYEGIKNLDGCQRNPQFWLQYAIACLTLDELDRARKYFDTAYSLARARGYDTYQIDNHYARFLLVWAVEREDSESCMDYFRYARNIIQSQIKDNTQRHYPYRVATTIHDFYAKYQTELSAPHLNEIKQAASYIARQIEGLPDGTKYHRYVSECNTAMKRIIRSQPEQ